MIKDGFGRIHDYLRISLTDACNFRCTYCMPDEEMHFKPSAHLMQPDEINAIAGMFVKMGVRKIRLTGGEPLVRKEAAEIIRSLSKYPVDLTLTTNGSRTHEFINVFKEAGIRSVNVSLDTLQPEKFFAVTRRALFQNVWDNIQELIKEGFHVKVNAVMMRGYNDDEIIDFIQWTKEQPVHIRFIEFMPFAGNHWDNHKVINYQEILDVIAERYDFIKLLDEANATAKKFKVYNHEGTFAIISTMSAPFCSTCNRMRLTADGKMKNCLFSKGEVDLLTAYRNGEDIMPLIEQCVFEKEEALGGQFTPEYEKIDAASLTNRSMIRIGG
ncbi:MAG TPA: GTP 3',8-cyclase MoaA [Saprospiraceae bacterium]